MKLQEGALLAAAATCAHECAAPQVAQPHRAPDLGRDVARTGDATGGGPRLFRRPELALGEVRQQGREGTIQDDGLVARGHGVTQQVLREPQLLERVAADRHLDLVAVR